MRSDGAVRKLALLLYSPNNNKHQICLGKITSKKIALVESSKTTLNPNMKSFGQVIIFEIGTHYENADIVSTIKTLIIHSTHTII